MRLPAAEWRARAGLACLLDSLGAAEGAVRPVGGVVRDSLLGLSVTDIDLATSHSPEETQRRIVAAGFAAVPTGLAHGTITAVLPDGPVEITTLRHDISTDGRHAQVAFTDDWREDAARRDFTINALSADPLEGHVFDYFEGLPDLAAGLVRFIGDPLRRIAEDHLRILRFFRFHARFGRGAADEAGLAACTARANDLMALSRERIAQEMLKLLAVDDPVPAVRLMVERGILAPVLPEITPGGVDRLATLVVRERAIGDGSAVRRLAALLPPDAEAAAAVSARLRLSKAQRSRITRAVDALPPQPPRALAYRLGVEGAGDRLLLHAPHEDLAPALDAIRGWEVPRLPIGGRALIAMGLAPGPVVAATLAAVERRWIDESFPDQDRVAAIAREEASRIR